MEEYGKIIFTFSEKGFDVDGNVSPFEMSQIIAFCAEEMMNDTEYKEMTETIAKLALLSGIEQAKKESE